jgi:protein O-GlcNAc transferase
MKKIISFSLWGNNPKYVFGAMRNADLAKILYPDWKCRFYVGKSTLIGSEKEINYLNDLTNTEIYEMDQKEDWTGMFWRFLACSDPNVEVMISRDCDSRISMREKFAVIRWLDSGKAFHIMRDHPNHDSKILGGMWGARTRYLNDMENLINQYTKNNYWQIDQEFLNEIIYPRIESNCIIHDEFFCGIKFPNSRKNLEFVGEIFDENEKRNEEHQEILKSYLLKNKKWFNKFKW